MGEQDSNWPLHSIRGCRLDSDGLEYRPPTANCCENDKKTSSIQGGEFLDKLFKDYAPYS
jgi:hypothetical protein